MGYRPKIIDIIIILISIKYLSNTLATRKNLSEWSISQSSACAFCLQPESLQHIVSSCKSYLQDGRYTWRHNSVLLYLAKALSSFSNCSLYADLPSYLSPSLITGDSPRPDLVMITKNCSLYILELTLEFESNMQINSNHKATNAKLSLLTSILHTPTSNHTINTVVSIAIRYTFYVFCRRNKFWPNPELLDL